MQRALESALAELALGPEIGVTDHAGIAAWLARHRVAGEDAAALTRDFARLQVYRRLVRGNLREALRATMPRTLARLGSRFEPYFAQFLRLAPPVEHTLRELTPRFLEFVEPRWAIDPALPQYIWDLARHEATQVEVASLLGRAKHRVSAKLELDEPVEFVDAVRLVRYEWAVHRLPDDDDAMVVPEHTATSLLVYRSPEHAVRYLELGSFAASLVSGLLRERLCLRLALESAAAEQNEPLAEALLGRAARLLADFAERGLLLGSAVSKAEARSQRAVSAGIPA